MKRLLKSLVVFAVGMMTAAGVSAQTTSDYKIHKYTPNDGGIFEDITPNGEWAIIRLGTSAGGGNAAPKLYNVAKDETIPVEFAGRAFNLSSVSNDGNVVAGSLSGRAAVLNRATSAIKAYPLRKDWQSSHLSYITPDGKWAVGSYNGYVGQQGEQLEFSNDYYYSPLFVNAETGDTIATPGLPKLDMTHQDQHAMVFDRITPDGRYIIGRMSWYYLQPHAGFVFVYDTQSHTYDVIGFTESTTRPWTPLVADLHHVEAATLSPDGHWLTGMAYMTHDIEGSSFANEYPVPFLYDMHTKEFKVFDDGESSNIVPGAIDNAGTIFGNPETGSPLRDFRIFYQNKYWIPLSQICKQVYGFNFLEKTGFDRTGTAVSVSGDGRRLVSFVDPLGESYIFDFGTTVEEVCDKIDLLDNYTISPASGSMFSQISSIEINFGRHVQVLGKGNTHVHLYKADGTKVADGLTTASGLELKAGSKTTVTATFRTRGLEAGTEYYVLIDEGAVAVANDASRVNRQIRVNYTGRRNGPVEFLKVAPEAHSKLRQIDASTSYLIVDFDCPVMLTDEPEAYIVRVDDGARIANLTMSAGNTEATKRQVLLTATSETYLYDGLDYKVVISAGSISDYSGLASSLNEKIEIEYHGAYIRESSNEDVLFADNFNNMADSYAKWLRYEGDHNNPLASMQSWGFDKDNYPWSFEISDDETFSDVCAGSHSLYAPSAKSDDWMITPRILMPEDGKAVLEFDAQSYNPAKTDVLTLYIYEQERNISYLNDANMAQIKKDAVLLDEITLSPGATQDKLGGEWTHYSYNLSKWAGKSIYIAFVNQNENQSAIFVDNVSVQRELLYAFGFSNADRVVGKSDITIAGQFTVHSGETVNSISLVLKDAAGKEVSRIDWPTITADIKGRPIPFTFSTPLPLKVGEENKYTIDVNFGSISDVYTGSILDLAFNTTKRVVLEEMTGIDCPNCPLGIVTIERCEKAFGEQFIPISIHTYDGDPYMGSFQAYSSFLGLNAAPSGRINRLPGTYFPIVSKGSSYLYTNPEEPLWYDVVAQELNKLTLADISVSALQSADGKNIDCYVNLRYALNASDQQLSLFAVVLEDGLVNYQVNAFGSVSQDVLGSWGAGGANSGAETGGYAYPVTHNDVVRGAVGQTFAGTIGLFPSTFVAGNTYKASFSCSYPSAIEDPANASVVVMLIDTQTGQVVNAAKTKLQPFSTAIEDVEASAQGTADIYTPAGVLVREAATRTDLNTLPSGIYLYGGKKVMVK